MKVTVLYGGPSAEREVSLVSGKAVIDGLRSMGHDVFPSDVSPTDLSGLDRPADAIIKSYEVFFPAASSGRRMRYVQLRRVVVTGPPLLGYLLEARRGPGDTRSGHWFASSDLIGSSRCQPSNWRTGRFAKTLAYVSWAVTCSS